MVLEGTALRRTNKKLFLITGAIGSGKSELSKRIFMNKDFNGISYIDADSYKTKYFDSKSSKDGYLCADELVFSNIKELCQKGQSFVFERCPTNYNKIESLKSLIKKYKYKVIIFFVDAGDLNTIVKRIIKREQEEFKEEVNKIKVKQRYEDTHIRIKELLYLADIMYFIDNSGVKDSMHIVAKYKKNKFYVYDSDCEWFNQKVKNIISR